MVEMLVVALVGCVVQADMHEGGFWAVGVVGAVGLSGYTAAWGLVSWGIITV
jgi:hypothetical protein